MSRCSWKDSSKSNNGSYDDVISTNLQFLTTTVTITNLQSISGEQVGLNIDLCYITSK